MAAEISTIKLAPTFGSYYYEDVSALQDKAVSEDERWFSPGRTGGFKRLRDLAETISIGLGQGRQIFWGDCVGVSYAGKSGRKNLFRHDSGLKSLNEAVLPWLTGKTINSLRQFSDDWDQFTAGLKEPLHPAIGYGVSQAVLSLLAPEGDFFRVIAREWNLPLEGLTKVPLQGSCGNDRYAAVDKMISRKIAAFPQSQVDDVAKQVGPDGVTLLEYARWLNQRIAKFGHQGYEPVISLDVHGALGKVFGGSVEKVADFLTAMEHELWPHEFRIESAILADSVDAQIELYSQLKSILLQRGSKILLAADEWANTRQDIMKFSDARCVDLIHVKAPDLGSIAHIVDAVLHVKSRGIQVLLGGSCVETDLSTKATVHVAMATRPDFLLVKPGMGFDEGFSLCHNEMARILSL
jgi:methylaspartate ammonia-lyase